MGRTALMRDHGVSYAELERQGVMLPVSRVEVDYRAPVGYDETVRVHTSLDRVRSREVVFAYHITRTGENGVEKTLARARTTLVCTDATGRPRRLPEAMRQRLAELAV